MADNLWSTLVGWLKIVLPLGALMLLSTLFLFSRGDAPTGDIPYAEIEEIARQARISAPRLAGMTDSGALVEITAARITPEAGKADAFRVFDLAFSITDAAGGRVGILAAEGALDARHRVVVLTGLSRIETSTGFAMETGGLTADLAAGTLQTFGALEVRAPFGRLTAGGLAVDRTENGQRLVFSGGVRLHYDPQG